MKKRIVLRLLRGEPLQAVSREMAVPIYKLERWRNCVLASIDAALKESENEQLEATLEKANRRIDELVAEVEILRKRKQTPRASHDRAHACRATAEAGASGSF